MSEERTQSGDAGPEGIPQRENSGVPEPSRTVSHNDQALPAPGGSGPANEELAWAKKHRPGRQTVRRPVPGSVFRKTELLGIAPPSTPDAIKKARQRTMRNIRDPNGEVAYRMFEDSFREFTCSLVERQDKVYDEMLLHVADLQQRIDTLELRLGEPHGAPARSAGVKG